MISKTHQRFSELLRNPRVLTNPEEFLGLNYKEVLNFWMILDELSKEQWGDVKKRYLAFFDETRSEWLKTRDLAWEASKKVVGEHYNYYAGCAAWDVANSESALLVTRELIAMHLILDREKPLTFFEMFFEAL